MMKRKGFTLLELIIAVTLAIVVMIAVVNVSTVMVRQHLQSVHRGEVNGVTLAALDSMNRDIQSASALWISPLGGVNGAVIAGCTNWSNIAAGTAGATGGGRLDATQPVNYFIYCIDATRFGSLYKWTGQAVGPNYCNQGATFRPVPNSCAVNTADNMGAGVTSVLVVKGDGTNFGMSYGDKYQASGPYFARSRDTNGVEEHYIVGNSTPTKDAQIAGKPGQYTPQYYKVDSRIDNVKSFNNSAD